MSSSANIHGRFKLIALDIDGTISTPETGIPESVATSIRECTARGIQVVIATGKHYNSVRGLGSLLSLTGSVITCNGAIVAEMSSGSIVFSHFMSSKDYSDCIRCLVNDSRVTLAVFTDRDIVCTSRHTASRLLETVGEQTSRFVASLDVLAHERVAKVLAAVEDPRKMRSVKADYIRTWTPRYSVAQSSERFVELTSPSASKGSALRIIANTLGVATRNIACVGDSENDLSMFAVAGTAIAVANASPEVLKAARLIVPSAAEGGASVALKYIINSCD